MNTWFAFFQSDSHVRLRINQRINQNEFL